MSIEPVPAFREQRRETSLADGQTNKPSHSGKFVVLYDDQCEICQACVSWLRVLDGKMQTLPMPIDAEAISGMDPRLKLEDCLRELHVLTPDRDLCVGWDAVASLARLFPATWLVGVLGSVFPFRSFGRLLYRFVAANRYSLSKCRGGACRMAKPEMLRKQAPLVPFWSCYMLGFFVHLPLIAWASIAGATSRASVFLRTYGKKLEFLNGKLTILFLHGALPNAVPLLFGELFTAVLYNGVVVDPGSPKMRRSLARHLRLVKSRVSKIVATHAHEEHVGNLDWISERTGAPIYLSRMTAKFLRPFKNLPWVRALIIGQPPDLKASYSFLTESLSTDSGELRVLETPGHCDDHIVLYDPKEKVLLAGDAFMGEYFSTPNPDVDSQKWLDTLRCLMDLDIEILVEGHGHIHTLRPDIPDFPGVVVREAPRAAMEKKIAYLNWLREQIQAGVREGLPPRVIEASCFPWGRRSSWESFANDECIRLLSLGHFSRTELVRSFVRQDAGALPTVYEVRMHRVEPRK